MAKSASTKKQAPATAENDLYDLDNMPSTESSGAAMIETAGILHDLQVKFALEDGDYKDKSKGKWSAFSVTVTDKNGLELKELYFKPASTEEELKDAKYLPKFYELVEGKSVSTRDCTAKEALKVYNNEFLAYLIDLGEALGYTNQAVKEHLYKNAKGFDILAKAFIEKFRPTEITRISAKVKWFNNRKKETSNIGIHGPFTVYYPFGNDLFDVYKKDRPTSLVLTKYEKENHLVKEFTSSKAAADAPSGENAVEGKTAWQANNTPNDIGDDDPF